MTDPDLDTLVKQAAHDLSEYVKILKVEITPELTQGATLIIMGVVRGLLEIPLDLRRKLYDGGVEGAFLIGIYGLLLAAWSEFELLLELLIKRELNLDDEETSIVCGSLPPGTKMQILKSLVSRDPGRTAGIALLTKTQEAAFKKHIRSRIYGRDFHQIGRPLFSRDQEPVYCQKALFRHTFDD